MVRHSESRKVPTVQITLREAAEVLDLMEKSVRKPNRSITVYKGGDSVQVENPADLAADTLVPDTVRNFELEVKATEPYAERVHVDCRTTGTPIVDVIASSEEWIVGKLGIVTRYLGARPRRTRSWMGKALVVWVSACYLYLFESINYLLFAADPRVGSLGSSKLAPVCGQWLLVGLVTLWVGERRTRPSLLEVRAVPSFRKDLARDVLLPVSCGVSANLLFTVLRKFLGV